MKITEQMVHNKIAQLIQHALETNEHKKYIVIWLLILTIVSALHIAFDIYKFIDTMPPQLEYIGDEVPQYEIDIEE